MRALRDNVSALAEGASGAPSVLPNIGANVSDSAIGSYVFAYKSSGPGANDFGNNVSGSNLRPASAARGMNLNTAPTGQFGAVLDYGDVLSGTWKCMGTYDGQVDTTLAGGTMTLFGATLWVRIA